LSKSPWRRARLMAFWRFVAERHEIFRRRIILREPPPWTKDKVLRSVAFTNIYRELDRTTRELILSLEEHKGASDYDVLFNIIKFRFFTWTPTYRWLGGFRPYREWPRTDTGRYAQDVLVGRQLAGEQVFTGAFMVTSLGAEPGLGGKVKLVCQRIDWVRQNMLRLWAVYSSTMPQAHRILCEVPGFGGFMAYEVLVDLTYTGRVPFNRDEWVYVGPGAIKGLKCLMPSGFTIRQQHADGYVKVLRDSQRKFLDAAGARLNGPPLTLEAIEQALCEFQKYVRFKATGRAKRKYQAVRAEDYSLWDGIPKEFLDRGSWVQ
jgi:hypothetical protein